MVAVLGAAGRLLGSLAGRDLAARVREGRLDARGKAASRRERKRALTALSSSRWAGAITRTSQDQWGLAERNLRAERSSLLARTRRIEARIAVPAGGRAGRTRGYANPAEQHGKVIRLQVLRARLARVERQLDAGMVAVVRGGRALFRKRANLTAAGLTEAGWREQWDAARLFLTADGEASKAWGNETIRWNSDEQWLEIKLPAPLSRLANRPCGRYRLSCPVAFPYRGDAVAAQAATAAVRYDITLDAASGRWYLDASWRTSPQSAPPLGELRKAPVVAVDVNAGHLAAAVVAADGNIVGVPVTIPLDLAGLTAATRDGRLRAAISGLIAIARDHGARAIVIEDLDFAQSRAEGREQSGNRSSRGRRGRAFRRAVSGIPTGKFRDRLIQMARNAGLEVVAVDPAYTTPLGRAALARPPAGPAPASFRSSRCGSGDRQACARPPGAATGRRDRRWPEDQRPESCPPSTRGHAHHQERQAPQGPAAATPMAQDRDGHPAAPARPGSPRPFGAAR
jgi:IS605 OrfB family transposase